MVGLFRDPDAEELSFPRHYGGVRMTRSFLHKKVHYSRRVQWELRHCDRRFANDITSIFFKVNKMRQMSVTSMAQFRVRQSKLQGRTLTAKDMMNPNVRDELLKADIGDNQTNKIRGSPGSTGSSGVERYLQCFDSKALQLGFLL